MTSEVDADPTVPTLEMVAARAGVSRSTVSRVVNGSTSVTADVLAAVQAAIEEL
ncbi:MAG: Bacterial regulatory protein lacI family, partial [Actinomycetota bacterium]|nr:Bacterial regulatory protein lacI family [Actinomycetota bacterium]